jgi:hypothetical protein
MGIALPVLAVVCSILTILTTVAIGDIYSSDLAGRGIAAVFALGIGLVLWILLGVFVATAKAKGAFSTVPPLLLYLIVATLASGCFTAMVLVTKVGEHSPFLSSLLFLVPAGSVLLLVYGLLDSFGAIPQQHASTIAVAGGIIAGVLVLAPWIEAGPAMAHKQAQDAELYAAYLKREEAEGYRKQELDAIPQPGSMDQFMEFVDPPPDWSGAIRLAATTRMKQLSDRQQETERLLKQQDLRVLLIIGDIDLKVTPSLIEGTKSCFRAFAERHRPLGPKASFDSVSSAFNPYFSALRWLNDNGHTPIEELDMLAAMARQYPETEARTLFLAGLEYYRTPPSPSSPRF